MQVTDTVSVLRSQNKDFIFIFRTSCCCCCCCRWFSCEKVLRKSGKKKKREIRKEIENLSDRKKELKEEEQKRVKKVKAMAVGSISAEDLSTIGGIATVSLLHSFIPTHWLPFSIVGRAQKWTLSRTLLVSTSPTPLSLSLYFFFFLKLKVSYALFCYMHFINSSS